MRLVYLNVASPDYPLNIKSALSPQFQSFSQYRCKTAKKSEEEIDFLRSNPKIWNVHSVLNVLHSLVDKSNINRQLEVYTSGGEIAGWGWCLCCLALIWLSSVSFVWGLNQTLSNWVSLLGRGSLKPYVEIADDYIGGLASFTYKQEMLKEGLPPLEDNIMVCYFFFPRWSRKRGWWVWSSLPLQDAGLFQSCWAAASALFAGGLLPSYQGSGEHWAQQEGNKICCKHPTVVFQMLLFS